MLYKETQTPWLAIRAHECAKIPFVSIWVRRFHQDSSGGAVLAPGIDCTCLYVRVVILVDMQGWRYIYASREHVVLIHKRSPSMPFSIYITNAVRRFFLCQNCSSTHLLQHPRLHIYNASGFSDDMRHGTNELIRVSSTHTCKFHQHTFADSH